MDSIRLVEWEIQTDNKIESVKCVFFFFATSMLEIIATQCEVDNFAQTNRENKSEIVSHFRMKS